MRVFKKVPALAGMAAVVLAATTAVAHHSFNMFDNVKTIPLTGTIKEFAWGNPHCWVQIMVTDPATGTEVEWSIETSSPAALTRAGWKKTSVKPGDKAEMVVHPLKDGSTGGSLVTLYLNGDKTGLRDPQNPK